jgi:hypothetical protein
LRFPCSDPPAYRWRNKLLCRISFFDKEKGKGVLLAFRHEKCKESALSVTLPYIKEDAVCELTDEDSGEILRITDREMAEQGFTLNFENPRSSRLLWVKEIR